MQPDPFQNFGEQQRSYELLEEHRAALVADALEILREHPQLEVVGLIVDGDASEAAALQKALEHATRQSFAGRGFVGVAPRQFVLEFLRANAPATLEWLPADPRGSVFRVPRGSLFSLPLPGQPRSPSARGSSRRFEGEGAARLAA